MDITFSMIGTLNMELHVLKGILYFKLCMDSKAIR